VGTSVFVGAGLVPARVPPVHIAVLSDTVLQVT
jgi:hypothetical protein